MIIENFTGKVEAYPQNKWDKHLEIKKYFEDKIGKRLEDVV